MMYQTKWAACVQGPIGCTLLQPSDLIYLLTYFRFWATPGSVQGLLLSLDSGITPSGAWGILQDAEG